MIGKDRGKVECGRLVNKKERCGHLGLRMLSICDTAVNNRDKKMSRNIPEGVPEDDIIRELTSHFCPLPVQERGCTTMLRWLIVGAVKGIVVAVVVLPDPFLGMGARINSAESQ